MRFVARVQQLLRPIVRWSYRDGEEEEERVRKGLLLPIFVSAAASQILVSVRNLFGAHPYRHITAGAVFLYFLGCSVSIVATKSLSLSKTAAIITGATLLVLVLDVAAYGLFDFSAAGILGMDCMLLCRCSDRSTLILRNFLVVYHIVMAIEQTYGLGLYDSIPEDWTGFDRPKSRGKSVAVSLILVRLIVFLGDFFATRYFAKSMMERETSILASVDVAQKIAASLARFDLEHANELIGKAENLSTDLREAFTTLVGNLRSYKPYLPQSCLPDEVADYKAEDTDEGDKLFFESTMLDSSGSSVHILTGETAATGPCSLQYRHVVLMAANIAGFFPKDGSYLPSRVASQVENYICTVVESVRAHRGLTESFSGDRILATFNAAKHCASAEKQAVDCAMQLKGAVQLPDEQRLVAAITGGSAMCGPMGSEGMMRYTILGHVSSWVFVMERYLTRTGLTCGVDSSVFGRVEPMYHLRLVDIVQFVKAADRTKIYEPTAPKELATEEWMYQLERSMNSWEIYNKVRAALVLGSPLSSEDLLALRKQATVPEVVALLRDVEAGGPRLVTTICDIGLSQASASSPPSTDSLSYESPQREHTSLLSRCSTLQSL